MPKVKYLDSPDFKAFVERVTASEGHMCSLSAVGRIIGYKNTDCVKRWLDSQGITGRKVNGHIRYDTYDVAKRLRG